LGKIVVTGATGGVGSFAVDMLSRRGYEVCAVTGKKEMIPALKELGAHEVVLASDFPLEGRPLESVKWGGAIDNVGGTMVPALVRSTNLWGNVALIGVAGGAKFESTVFPHILRGVNVLGVSSANCPMPLRRELWQKLAGEFKPVNLKSFVTAKVKLGNLEQVFSQMLERKTHGRYVVDCSL
jgi:NADPH2:quinone reductase